MSPMSMLRYARLSLFARVAMKSPPALVGLLSVMWELQEGWVSGVRSDLHWLSFSGCLPCSLGCVSGVFESLSGSAGGLFVKRVRRYAASRFANFDVPVSVQSLAPPIFLPCNCTMFGEVFAFYQRVRVHMQRVHSDSFYDTVGFLVYSVHCPVCTLYFHNHVRLLNHLRYRSNVCRLNLTLLGPLVSELTARRLDDECRACFGLARPCCA